MRQVAAWMEHAGEDVTTTIYTHLFAEDSDVALAALGAGGRTTASTLGATVTPMPVAR